MNATLSNNVDTLLYPQYYADPADIALRSALCDALRELGRLNEIETIEKEWECRAWFIAKGRKSQDNYLYYCLNELPKREEYNSDHWIPYMTEWKKSSNSYQTIAIFYDDWNALTDEQKEILWNWNPPT